MVADILDFPTHGSAKESPVCRYGHIDNGVSPFVNAPVGARSYFKHETRLADEVGSRVSIFACQSTADWAVSRSIWYQPNPKWSESRFASQIDDVRIRDKEALPVLQFFNHCHEYFNLAIK